MEAIQRVGMADEQYRALLTEREREILAGEADVSDNYRYRVVSRVRTKYDALKSDAALLKEHHPDLLAELRDAVCAEIGEVGEQPTAPADRPPAKGEVVGDDNGHESTTSTSESVDNAIDGVDLPGSGAKLDARREAVRAAVEHLREYGTATPAEFKSDVYPDHRARHTEGEDPANAWWKRTVSTGLKQVAERTAAVEPADTSGVWRWAGSDGE